MAIAHSRTAGQRPHRGARPLALVSGMAGRLQLHTLATGTEPRRRSTAAGPRARTVAVRTPTRRDAREGPRREARSR